MKKLTILFLILMVASVPSAFADGPIDDRDGRAEVRFLEGMIDHHQMALDMAAHCLEKAEAEEVRAKCQEVIEAQSAEIETMRGWLRDWYGIEYTPMAMNVGEGVPANTPASEMSMMDMMGMMQMMEEMSMSDMMGMMEGMDGDMSMMDMMHGMMEGHEMDSEGMMGMMGNMSMMDMMQMMNMMQMMENTSMSDMMGMMEGMDGDMSMMDMMHGMMEGGMGNMGGNRPGGQQQGPNQGGEHEQHHSESGAMTDPAMTMGMMAGLNHLEGREYDIAWLEAMIDHHDDAIHMSERILRHEGIHDETAEIARQIIADQTDEIDEMEAMIETLSAE